jgi:hypothetical protein
VTPAPQVKLVLKALRVRAVTLVRKVIPAALVQLDRKVI